MTKWEYCELRAELHSKGTEFDGIMSMELWTSSGLQLRIEPDNSSFLHKEGMKKPDELIKQLSLLGDEGWELVFVTPIGGFTGQQIKLMGLAAPEGAQLFTFYFKRPA
ncbi:MAG: hypothetical protein H8E40_03175 [Chloroflexi bacterium]|nr:hypothetical protein [Chloroflexota bacterium]